MQQDDVVENDENFQLEEDFEDEKQDENQKMGKSFRLIKKIDSGTFSDIYLGRNVENNAEVVVKVEPIQSKNPMLFYEAKVYNYILKEEDLTYLQQLCRDRRPKIDKGFPEIYYCSNEGDYNIMIMELLGSNLEDLFMICDRKFSAKTVCMIGLQILDRLEFLHGKWMVHRDLKPANFCIGKGKKKDLIYMIDLGFAKKFATKDRDHLPMQEQKNFTGTLLFSSLNVHKGLEYSRRDDIESLAYMMIYFLKGQLPWSNIKSQNLTKKQRLDAVSEKKSINPDSLFKNLNIEQEFKDILKYSQNLEYEERPDYDMIRKKLQDLMNKNGWENDNVYQWNLNVQSQISQVESIMNALKSTSPRKSHQLV